ncbi:DUF4097 family beta strand repeat-containing protein [Streptomyces sp. MB09-02B]|uniref:DUF4097 family beta strand repeat-containing protein n=1 Tax=Streptomyces sp. MB09-02B TaxID=3028667 RepID=UPI0029AC8D86|nr:DUF4097 family beta strand repeat-containing protein [Streptomyces sp. MB09-02B]MDX3646347.1 DUF4097 family beta strand repeat-containing protein [Streptomyces sp. MB09-02B]
MPSYDTPEAITAIVEYAIGNARIIASDSTETVVDVQPSNPSSEADLKAVKQTKVTCSGGVLTVKGPRKSSPFGKVGGIDITIALPAGSTLEGTTQVGDFHCSGRLGETRLKTSVGDLHVEEAATARLKSELGMVHLDRATASVEIIAAGRVTVGTVAGGLIVKNGNGDTELAEITGTLEASAANGRIDVGTAHSDVEAKSANGGIRLGRVTRGRVTLRGAVGDLEVGIPETTAAWLDVHTDLGALRSALGSAEGPGDATDTVEVTARTSVGDIRIHRA